jgi:hypothetical protein
MSVVPDTKCLALVDGYLRVGSMGTLGKDTVNKDVSETGDRLALLQLLGSTRQRHWEAVEQAWFIRETRSTDSL